MSTVVVAPSPEAERQDEGLKVAVTDLIRALRAEDIEAAAAAFQAAYDICDAQDEPGNEGEV